MQLQSLTGLSLSDFHFHFSGGSVVKNLPANAGEADWIPVRKNTWRRKYQPTPVFLLEIPTDGGAWRAAYHGVSKSQTPLGQPSTRS